MGRDSGLGLLVGIVILALALKPRKLTASDFVEQYTSGPSPPAPFSYTQYVRYVTKGESELEEGEALEESVTTSGRVGRWLTVNGMIPTPSGGRIPMISTRDYTVRAEVDKFLQPIEEAPAYSDEPQDRLDPKTGKTIIDVSARLKPV